MATLHATALFFLMEDSQNSGWQKAVRVGRPLSKHELLGDGCLEMATRATFDEYCRAYLRKPFRRFERCRMDDDEIATGDYSKSTVVCSWGGDYVCDRRVRERVELLCSCTLIFEATG